MCGSLPYTDGMSDLTSLRVRNNKSLRIRHASVFQIISEKMLDDIAY